MKSPSPICLRRYTCNSLHLTAGLGKLSVMLCPPQQTYHHQWTWPASHQSSMNKDKQKRKFIRKSIELVRRKCLPLWLFQTELHVKNNKCSALILRFVELLLRWYGLHADPQLNMRTSQILHNSDRLLLKDITDGVKPLRLCLHFPHQRQ